MTMAASAKSAALLGLLLALPAAAAGPEEGIKTASEAAEMRVPDAVLVEIEGFTDPEGDIPCAANSFSSNWQYKFYSAASGDWLIVNACGTRFMNAAKHFPTVKADESVTRLPAVLAAPGSVLKKLRAAGILSGNGSAGSREILMTARNLPEKDGRPEGCYWLVSQGKAKALADCRNKKDWALGGGTGPKLISVVSKGKDTAGRYSGLAVKTVRRKAQEAQLYMIESLVDRTGSAKCIAPEDGWSYTFSSPEFSNTLTFRACKGKTAFEDIDFSGKTGAGKNLSPIPQPFKDSDFSLSKAPPGCVKDHSTISMKLQNFKQQFSPFAGHSLIWTADCGSLRYYIDGYTGQYLGPGKK